jgi:hypothetical protein
MSYQDYQDWQRADEPAQTDNPQFCGMDAAILRNGSRNSAEAIPDHSSDHTTPSSSEEEEPLQLKPNSNSDTPSREFERLVQSAADPDVAPELVKAVRAVFGYTGKGRAESLAGVVAQVWADHHMGAGPSKSDLQRFAADYMQGKPSDYHYPADPDKLAYALGWWCKSHKPAVPVTRELYEDVADEHCEICHGSGRKPIEIKGPGGRPRTVGARCDCVRKVKREY